MSFSSWLKTQWTSFLNWFGLEEQKLSSFLYPIFQDAKVIIAKDALQDVIDGVPVVAAALSGGTGAAVAAATAFIIPVLEKQGVQLAETTVNVLANALVAQAKASLASTTGTPNAS